MTTLPLATSLWPYPGTTLPDFADSQVQLFPAFPDHRTPSEENSVYRNCVATVPLVPYDV